MWTPERIKSLRVSYDERQDDFAARFRLTVEAIRNWEQGKQVPSGPATVILDQLQAAIQRDLQPVSA